MLVRYLDASAWAKRYTREPGCSVIDLLMDGPATSDDALLLISGVAYAETVATANRFRHRTGMSDEDFILLLQRIRQDLARTTWIPVTDRNFRDAVDLILAHNINSSDAAQLATIQGLPVVWTAEASHQVYVVSADKRMLRAAKREGLKTLDPEVATLRETLDLLTNKGD